MLEHSESDAAFSTSLGDARNPTSQHRFGSRTVNRQRGESCGGGRDFSEPRIVDEPREDSGEADDIGAERRNAASIYSGGFDGPAGSIGGDRHDFSLERVIRIGVLERPPARNMAACLPEQL